MPDSRKDNMEHILILVHSLTTKQREPAAALNEVRTLQGIIPICSHCKQIRADEGF